MLQKIKIIFILFISLFCCLNIYATEENSSLDVIEKVERNLIYSKEILKENPESIIIKKGGWNNEKTKEIENTTQEQKKIKTEIKKVKEDKTVIALKRKAYDAININQYEIAIHLYKQVLEIDKNDIYATLGLATAYQYLGQYIQAKPLFLKVLEIFPTDQQIMSNLLSIITDETPYEAVYLLSNIADKNQNSSLIQAQTSVSYAKIKNYEKAISYIKRAIELDQDNLEYRYNLAVLYDLNQQFDQAKFLYNELLTFYSSSSENTYNLPLKEIEDRVEMLQNNSNNKKRK